MLQWLDCCKELDSVGNQRLNPVLLRSSTEKAGGAHISWPNLLPRVVARGRRESKVKKQKAVPLRGVTLQ